MQGLERMGGVSVNLIWFKGFHKPSWWAGAAGRSHATSMLKGGR